MTKYNHDYIKTYVMLQRSDSECISSFEGHIKHFKVIYSIVQEIKKALYFTGNFFTNFDAEIQILKINLPQDIFSKVKFEISGFVTNLRLMQ